MIDRAWYQRTMCDGQPIPAGVTINPADHRSEQSCEVCGEFVDHAGMPFTATRCRDHQPDPWEELRAQGLDELELRARAGDR